MYRVNLTARAERDLTRLAPSMQKRVRLRLRWLEQNAEHVHHRVLSGPLADLYKLRVGDYRILYDVFREDQVILVHRIGHRRDVYREK